MDKQLIDQAKRTQKEIDDLARDIMVSQGISAIEAYDRAEEYIKERRQRQDEVINKTIGENVMGGQDHD